MRVLLLLLLVSVPAAARPGWPPGRHGRLLAQAQTSADCVVTEINATKEGKGFDPKISKLLREKLAKPPFTVYDTFVLVSEPTVAAEKDKPAAAVLSDGAKVTLLLKDRIAVENGKARLRFAVDIDDKSGRRVQSTIYTIEAGDPIFPRVDGYEKNARILALTCALPPPPPPPVTKTPAKPAPTK